MNNRVAYVAVGLFVVVLGALLAFGAVWFSTDGLAGKSRQYLVFFPGSVTGLNVDAPVRYNGVRVGHVADIRLDKDNPQRVRVVLEVAMDAPVKIDTVATLQMQGLTGIAHVNLRGGSPDAPDLETASGRPYPEIEGRPPVFADLDRRISELLENLNTTSNQLNRLLRPENRRIVERTLNQIENLSAHLARQSEAVAGGVGDFNATVGNVRRASERLPELLQRLNESAVALGDMAKQLAATSGTVRTQVERTAPELNRFTRQALPDAAALVGELRRAAENLHQTSIELQRDPSVMLYGRPRPSPGPGE